MSEKYTDDELVVYFEVERKVLTNWVESFRVPKATFGTIMDVLGEDAATDNIRSALRRMGHEPTTSSHPIDVYGRPIEKSAIDDSDFVDIDDEYVTAISVRKASSYYDV